VDLTGQWLADLTRAQEEDEGLILADMMRFLEQDELRKIKEEHEYARSLGSSHVDVGGGDVQLYMTRTWEALRQLMRERPAGPRHVDVGGGAAHELDQWTMNFVSGIVNIGGRPIRMDGT
jgi:hypothetical protein